MEITAYFQDVVKQDAQKLKNYFAKMQRFCGTTQMNVLPQKNLSVQTANIPEAGTGRLKF